VTTASRNAASIQAAAKRRGLTTDEYLAKLNAGLKWCRACQDWRPLNTYNPSTSTHDGVRPLCTRHYIPRKPPSHGYAGYQRGCRCNECRTAGTRYQARQRANRKADPSRADRAGHGKRSTYNNYACRCDACTAAQSQYMSQYAPAYRARKKAQSA